MTPRGNGRTGTVPLRIAVIGCGYWGVNYLRVLHELPAVELAAICEPRADRLQEVGSRYPDVPLLRNIDDVLRRTDVDACVVATSATTHAAVARRCLDADKHVLVEKPLATSSDDAAELVRSADERGLVLMVGHTFLYNASVQRLKTYFEDGSLGRIYYLYSRRTNLGPVRYDVNALWDLAPHDISIFNHLLGTGPEWVSATAARLLGNAREDVGFVTLGYPGGIIGNVHVSWVDPNKVRELVAVGSNCRVVFDDTQQTEPIRLYEKGVSPSEVNADDATFPLQIRDGDIVSPRISVSEPLKNQCRHFLECVEGDLRPATSGSDGLRIVAIMEAVTESIGKRGEPVALRDEPPAEGQTLTGNEVLHGQ